MNIHEAMVKIKKNPKKVFTHSRWFTSEYIYYKKGKYYQEDGIEFDAERQGLEILQCTHTQNEYSIKKKINAWKNTK